MKKRLVCLLIFCALSLSSTVFATSWVRVGTDDYYIDSETAVKNGDIFCYWEVYVEKETNNKRLIHYSVSLDNPTRGRILKGYLYDSNDRLLNEIIRPHSISVELGGSWDKAIGIALSYTIEGESNDITPALP